MQGVRGREHLSAPTRQERVQGVRGAGASASTSTSGAGARRCQMGGRSSGKAPWAVVMRPAREDLQSSVASHSRQEVLGTIPSVHEDYLTKKKGVCLAPAKHATTHT